MTSSHQDGSHYRRRILWLGIFVSLAVAGYVAAWFYIAGRVQTEAERILAEANRDDVTAECVNPTTRGFPFRIGIFCDSVALADRGQGASLSAGKFRSAAQIYNPFRIVGDLESPARIETPQFGAIKLEWELLHGSARLADPLPQRASVETRQLVVTRDGDALLRADNMQAHMRPNGADLDVALSFDVLAIDPAAVDGRNLPPFSGTADLTLVDGLAILASGAEDLRGKSGTVRSMTLKAGPEGGFTMTGDVAVGDDGLIDANLQVSMQNPNALSRVAQEAFPEARDNIRTAFSGLALLGRNPTMPLRIKRGRATLGFIPLGNIPPL